MCWNCPTNLQSWKKKKFGTDESIFNKYFCTLSTHELTCVSWEYHKLTEHTILKAVDKEFSGDSKKSLRTIAYATLLSQPELIMMLKVWEQKINF